MLINMFIKKGITMNLNTKTLAGIVIIIVIIAGLGLWLTFQSPQTQERKLIIYTYDYFFGLTGESVNSSVYKTIFDSFSEKYGVKIEVRFFDGAKNILLTTVTEKKAGARTADILIGLDNVAIQEAKKHGILEKLDPNKIENLSLIDQNLVNWYDPDLYGIPYDFGPIAFTYDSKRINITQLTFDDFVTKGMDRLLVVESPMTSTTGEAFLLWEIAFYEKILNKSWGDWWQQVKDNIIITQSWGDAYFGYFLDETKNRPIVVSYLTSPVYHWLYEGTLRYKSALITHNNKTYAWSQIQGISIVKDSPMKDIAYKFIDWLISNEIQMLVAENDIMLPANTYAINHLSSNVTYALGYNLSQIEYLNAYLTPNEIYQNIDNWIDNWDSIISGYTKLCTVYATDITTLL